MLSSRRRSTRRKISIWIISMLALMVAGGAVASGASAHEWEVGGKSLEGLGVSSAAMEGTASSFVISANVFENPTELKCKGTNNSRLYSNTAGSSGATSTLSLGNCTVATPAHCSLAQPLTLEAAVSTMSVEGLPFKRYAPASGSAFGADEFAGSLCPLLGDQLRVKGEFVAQGSLTEYVPSKVFNISPKYNEMAGAMLKLNTEPAMMSGQVEEKLSAPYSGEPWRELVGSSSAKNWEVGGVALGSGEELRGGEGVAELSISQAAIGTEEFTCSAQPVAAEILAGGTQEMYLLLAGCASSRGCYLNSGGTLRSSLLVGHIQLIGNEVYETFSPSGGSKSMFAFEITGPHCSWSSLNRSIAGSITGIGKSFPEGRFTQPLEFSLSTNAAAGSVLTFGTGSGVLGDARLTFGVSETSVRGSHWGTM